MQEFVSGADSPDFQVFSKLSVLRSGLHKRTRAPGRRVLLTAIHPRIEARKIRLLVNEKANRRYYSQLRAVPVCG